MYEKVTMVLKVDLQCPCCYKKVKKILCKFPQIGEQVYDEKANTVTITVVCSNPEKIRDKLYCKGCKVIKCIEIKKPKPPGEPKPEPEKPQSKPEKPKPKPEKPKSPCTCSCTCPCPGTDTSTCTWTCTCTYTWTCTCTCPGTCTGTCRGPTRTCCGSCYKGCGGGPCYHGYRVLPPPQRCYDEYYVYGYDQRGCFVM